MAMMNGREAASPAQPARVARARGAAAAGTASARGAAAAGTASTSADSGAGTHPADRHALRTLAIELRDFQRASLIARHALAQRLGLGISDVNALDQIVFSAEPLGPVDLAHRLGMTSASATALADRLERAGHVRRVPHQSDRRRQRLEPTQHARVEVKAALGPLIQALDAAADGMSAADVEVVTGYLSRAAEAMRRYGSASPVSTA